MIDKRKEPRIYNWIIKSNFNLNSEDCKTFRNFIDNLLKMANHILEYDINRYERECFVFIKMECYPTGKGSAFKIQRELRRFYPLADAVELTRIRA